MSESSVTKFSVTLAAKALEMSFEVWDKDHLSIMSAWRVKINCLNRDARSEEALQECNVALEYLQSQNISDSISQDQVKEEYGSILIWKSHAFHCLRRWVEEEETLRQLLVGEHAPTQVLALVVIRHKLAYCLITQGTVSKMAEAKAISAELLAWAESMEVRLTIDDKSLHLNMLRLNASILEGENRLLGNKDWAQIEESSQTFLYTYETSLEFFGINHLCTWINADDVIHSLTNVGRLDQATLFLEQFLKLVTTSQSRLEGQFLHVFNDIWSVSLSLIDDLSQKGRRYDIRKLSHLWNLLNETTRALGGDPKEIVEDTNVMNELGKLHFYQGRFTESEKVFRALLGKGIDLSTVSDRLEDFVRYILMVVIALQPGRLQEAYKYRAEHEAEIVRMEATYGHLTTCMEPFEQDRLTYLEAQSRLAAGNLFVGDAWWEQHERAMTRTEWRYGFLDIPERKPQEQETTSAQDQGSPITASKTGQKGKSRAFFARAVFRRKQDHVGRRA